MRHYRLEGRCFVLRLQPVRHQSMHPADLPCLDELAPQPEIMCRGGSVIVRPAGRRLARPSTTPKASSPPTWTWAGNRAPGWILMWWGIMDGETRDWRWERLRDWGDCLCRR
ncbi:MAG: hypothetical protein H6644_10405 [Caldilineaceae bacterium]|nr:hypothetical protein [Caldilineaceae bacterium]